MPNMEKIVRAIKHHDNSRRVCIGGALVNQAFCEKIGVDSYNSGLQGRDEYLNSFAS